MRNPLLWMLGRDGQGGRFFGCLRLHWKQFIRRDRALEVSMVRIVCGAVSSHRTCDTLLPLHRDPRMGYAGRNSETEPTPSSSSSVDLVLRTAAGEARDARPPSTVVRLI